MKSKKYDLLVDPGHGGVCFGHYMTPGKRSPGKKTKKDFGIFEGEFNRQVAKMLEAKLPGSIQNINPGPINIPLAKRVSFANELNRKHNVLLISIHANASPKPGWSSASGFRIFYSKLASKKSKQFARALYKELIETVLIPVRPTKAVNHTITTKTTCPAILLECGFMTNCDDTSYMMGNQAHYVEAILSAFRKVR